jgi:hypothetical protein
MYGPLCSESALSIFGLISFGLAMFCSFVLPPPHHMRRSDFVSNRAAVCLPPQFGPGRFRVTRALRLTLQTGFIPLRKTKPYRLYKLASGRFQGETQVTKDEMGVADLVREQSSSRSETNAPLEAKQSLAHGDRVRMSALGRARHPRYGDLQGLVVGRGSPSSWRVKFDERKCIQAIHRDYLEKVGRSGASLSGRSDIKEIF